MSSDWISGKDTEFVTQCGKWKSVLQNQTKIAAFEWKETECGKVVTAAKKFEQAYSEYQENNSTLMRSAKDEAKKQAKQAMRDFANKSIRFNELVDEGTRIELGMRPKDTVMTPHQRPTSQPDTLVETTANRFEHRLTAINRETRTASKPADAYGVRFAWKTDGERPATGDDLPKGKFTRRTSLTVAFTEAEKGKAVWYAACYENSKGDAGPWSALAEAYIW